MSTDRLPPLIVANFSVLITPDIWLLLKFSSLKDKQDAIFHVLKGDLKKLPCGWAPSFEMRGLNLAYLILTSTSRELQHYTLEVY